jgi:tetratricopeptide (TPR) repeat protein
MNINHIRYIANILKIKEKYFPEELLTNNKYALKLNHAKQDKALSYDVLLEYLYDELNKPWGEITNYINSNLKFIEFANQVAISIYNDNYYAPLLIELFVHLLENNNILFHKHADYTKYQQLAKSLLNIIDSKDFNPIIKARGYFDSVYADCIFKNEESRDLYQKILLENLAITKHVGINEDLFLAYINISQFFLFKGDLATSLLYLEEAKPHLSEITILNYRALFHYHYSWIYVEMGNFKQAKENIEDFFINIKEQEVSPAIYLHALNINASIEFRIGNFEQSFLLAKKCYNLAKKFYQSEDKDVIAENLVTMGRYYKSIHKYDEAEQSITKAIKLFDKIFGKADLDPSQAVTHVLLGDIYSDVKKYALAKKEYLFSLEYYQRIYKNNFYNMHEVSIVLANLASLTYINSEYTSAKQYIKQLTNHFSADNDNVIKVMAILNDIYSNEQL